MNHRTVRALEQKVADFIAAHDLFAHGQRVLLAVSGGADSVALLAIMEALNASKVLPLHPICLHINHKLRGAHSDDDERFVQKLATEIEVPCVTQTRDISAYAATHKLSTETAGRLVRLRCFAEVARAQGCTWIATGHQKDDNAETLIQRLRRGTGFRGLAGIVPARRLEENLWLAHPLLCCTRTEIVAYLRSRGLSWRRDQTNSDCRYTRNYVRHRLLPDLQSRSSSSLMNELSALADSAQRLRQRVGRRAAREATQHVIERDASIFIDATALAALPEIAAVELIRRQLPKAGIGEQNMTQAHYQGVLNLAGTSDGKCGLTLPNGVQAYREHGHVILRKSTAAPAEPTAPMTVAIPGITTFAGRTIETRVLDPSDLAALDIRRDKNPNVEYLDLDRVDGPLVVRRRRPGDRFVPLGLSGQKKIGKFLTTARVPRSIREALLVFEGGRQIVWVCPVRISECAKVSRVTRRVLMLKVSM